MSVAKVAQCMPALLPHAGVWAGEYQYVDLRGVVTDSCRSQVQCVFPEQGPFDYIQKNRFEWASGEVTESEFGGVVHGDRLLWDTETFSGFAWTTQEDVVMLCLQRKDQPNTRFTEIIVMGADGNNRARTWHWFKDGKLFQRTLCNEYRTE